MVRQVTGWCSDIDIVKDLCYLLLVVFSRRSRQRGKSQQTNWNRLT